MGLLSVVIITYNEERYLPGCLESVREVADELIVLDSFSTDATTDIARSFGARVYQQKFAGYVCQKNRALQLASHKYVLSLDADEQLSETMIRSICEAKKNFSHPAYRLNRKAFYCGKFIRYGSWYPEPKIRLFDRTKFHWGGLDPHDRVITPASAPIGRLEGDILHFICETVRQHEARSMNFSTIAANSLYKAGRKTTWLKMVGSAGWFFLYDYILRLGFLNGWRGWQIARIQSRYHFEKYKKLYAKYSIPRKH